MEGVLNMAINPHDDYESLAKLLYPSIEASGNVYYGQTRKLTMDEVFDKNGKGFHFHIESFKKNEYDVNSEYETFFCWELGPLKGTVRVPEILPSIPMCFAKYKVTFDNKENTQTIYSGGDYKTYERSAIAEFVEIVTTHGKNPIDNETPWDGANFYVDNSIASFYLYIAIKDAYVYDDNVYSYEAPTYKEGDELTFHFKSTDPYTYIDSMFYIKRSTGSDIDLSMYQYKRPSDSGWASFTAGNEATVEVIDGDVLKVRLDPTCASSQDEDEYIHFSLESGFEASVSGDIRSLQSNKNVVDSYEFYKLFSSFGNLVSAKNLKLPSKSVGAYGYAHMFASNPSLTDAPAVLPASDLGESCYSNMFRQCDSLVSAPKLPATAITNQSCYEDMFNSCTDLKIGPELPATSISGDCYKLMFNGCTSLVRAPALPARYVPENAYYEMFSGCISLKIPPRILAEQINNSAMEGMFYDCMSLQSSPIFVINNIDASQDNMKLMFSGNDHPSLINRIYIYTSDTSKISTTSWLYNIISSNGDFYCDPDATFSSDVDGIPSGWNRHDIYKEYSDGSNELQKQSKYRLDNYVITSGTDSNDNGRGLLSDEFTLNHFENSFDEHGSHPAGTYNNDGSYNQDIWGYKTFNSPVMFRNGIYDDGASIAQRCVRAYSGGHLVNMLHEHRYSTNELVSSENNKTIAGYVGLFNAYTVSSSSLCAGSLDLNPYYSTRNLEENDAFGGDPNGAFVYTINNETSTPLRRAVVYSHEKDSANNNTAIVSTIVDAHYPKVKLYSSCKRTGTITADCNTGIILDPQNSKIELSVSDARYTNGASIKSYCGEFEGQPKSIISLDADHININGTLHAELDKESFTVSSARSLEYDGTAKITANSSELTAKTSIIPNSDNTYTLGSASFAWKNIYVSGGTSSGVHNYIIMGYDSSSDVSDAYKTTIKPALTNSGQLGTPNNHWYRAYINYIYVGSNATTLSDYITGTTVTNATNATKLAYSGTTKLTAGNSSITAYANVIPNSNNTYDLGSSNYRWRNIYVNGDSSYYIRMGYDSTLTNSTSKMSITPSANGYGYLGTSDKIWAGAYLYNLYIGYEATDISTYIKNTTVTNATNATNATNLSYSGTAKLAAGSSSVTAYTSIIPSSTGSYNLGSDAKKFDKLYVNNIIGAFYKGLVSGPDIGSITKISIAVKRISGSNSNPYNAYEFGRNEIYVGKTFNATYYGVTATYKITTIKCANMQSSLTNGPKYVALEGAYVEFPANFSTTDIAYARTWAPMGYSNDYSHWILVVRVA